MSKDKIDYIALYEKHGSHRKAAAAAGLNYTTFMRRYKKQCSATGQADADASGADTSTLYDAQGNVKLQWVKTKGSKYEQLSIIRDTVNALKEDIPRQATIPPPLQTDGDLLSCYILTDYHMGMLSWREETGDDWDSDIAADLLVKWFEAAIIAAPASATAVLAQLGDFMHYDALEAITPSSGHILDADTRLPRVVNMVIKVLRRVINMLLEKHEHVHIIMAEGNHDLASSVWLRALFAEKYADEPRITVDNTHTPYYVVEHGKTSLFFHHGHKKRPSGISELMAAQFREIYGRTHYSYAHLGHLHHIEQKENAMMIVEQHPTLAAKDAYAARGGWLSKRAASVITYSKQFGEVGRSTIRPEMFF